MSIDNTSISENTAEFVYLKKVLQHKCRKLGKRVEKLRNKGLKDKLVAITTIILSGFQPDPRSYDKFDMAFDILFLEELRRNLENLQDLIIEIDQSVDDILSNRINPDTALEAIKVKFSKYVSES